MKVCAKCGEKSAAYAGHLRCRRCYAEDQREQRRRHVDKRRAYDRNRPRRSNPLTDRARELRKFGLTLESYDILLESQGGVCAVCQRPERKARLGVVMAIAVDHDHDSGVVRGLLCNACNLGLGKFEDDPARLRAAADYLEANR